MKPRVLIIDDEDAVRSSLKMIFEYEGYETLQAANGPVGLKLAETRSEERRVGKECTSWCRSRWSPYH